MARQPRDRGMGDTWADQEEALFGFATSRPDEGPTRSSSSGGAATSITSKGGGGGSNGRRGAGRSSSNSGSGGTPSGTGAGTWRDSARSAGRTMQRGIDEARRRMEMDAYPGTIATVPPAAHDGSRWPWEDGRAGGRDRPHHNPSSRSGGNGGGGIDRRPGPTTTTSPGATPGSSSLLPELSLSSLSRRVTSALVNHASVPQCVVCGALAPSRYQYHPFFPEEIACSTHSDVGRCSGCNRFEPLPGSTFGGNHFADLGDRGRKLCPSCLRTVVTDSDEGRQLWFDALRYLDSEHGLLSGDGGCGGGVRASMEGIPVLVVEHDALNDPGVRGSGHGDHGRHGGGGGCGGHTRGLCVYEYTAGHPLGGQLRDFLRSAGMTDARGIIGEITGGASSKTRVTAVLCLRGLPRDLAASVLAHEATHAWFKLHPSYDPHCGRGGIPLVVEEGCCQLVAHLYLRHLEEGGDDRGLRDDGDHVHSHDHGPSDGRLRQYFRYSIETMTDEVYGEGFRLAAAAYAACGGSSPSSSTATGGGSALRALLDHVAENGSFPPPR